MRKAVILTKLAALAALGLATSAFAGPVGIWPPEFPKKPGFVAPKPPEFGPRPVPGPTEPPVEIVPGPKFPKGPEPAPLPIVPGPKPVPKPEPVPEPKPVPKPSVAEDAYGALAPADFSDVPQGHWAREAVREMARLRILQGVGEGRFEPDALVTREQFAKMLVLALGLPVDGAVYGWAQTFADVPPGRWSFRFVEAARNCLTGFKVDGRLLYKPELPAVREDMAVAIAKARGLPQGDPSVLAQFGDAEGISESLRPWVAACVRAGLMKGYPDGAFRPQGPLTRAEAAVLLYRVMQTEKVVVQP